MTQIDHPFEGLSHNLVESTGPSPCSVLFVGESPGHEEDELGSCFVGRTGRELDRFYLPMAALRRHEVRVANLIPVHPYANRNPTKAEVDFFEHYLLTEIAECNPEIIVPMGAFATKYFLGYHQDLHQVHGLLHRSKRFPGIKIVPSYHPAAGLHQTESQALITYDFQQVKLAIEGTLPERPQDRFANPTYIELTTREEVEFALDGIEVVIMGADTEGYKNNPWGLSFSVEEGIAYVIRVQSKEALQAFAEWITAHPGAIIVMHNALYDLPIYRDMGIVIRNFEDTMVYAYALCLEPQGLKDLAYRHCGMKMKSYEDTIRPAVAKLTSEYLIKVASGDWGLDPPVPEMESAREIKYRQPQALHKRALKAVNDIFGMYTGTIIGDRRGGSARLDEIGVRVGKVDHESVQRLGLRQTVPAPTKKDPAKTKEVQTMNAWFAEVPIPIMPKLESLYGEFIWELKDPEPPEDPADPIKRWEAMSEELEESTERCKAAIGTLPETGLDALEDQNIAIRYSARDAHATVAIQPKLKAKVEAAGMLDLARLDMAVLPYIDRMKTVGIKINKKHMLDYGAQLKIEMRELQEKLERNLTPVARERGLLTDPGATFWLNPSSSKQVAIVIYDMLGFPVEVRTKEGDPSTNDKVLEALAPLNANITDITDYRELHKLRNTYALELPNWMDENGRLHTNWKVTRVPSGRLAASDPNLMAIPIRSKRGNMIRKGFIPDAGHCFAGVDLSQVEMRVLAHLSRDPNLCKLFNEGRDFHTATAAFMWKLTFEEIEADHKLNGGSSMRSSGKNVSFGIVYGVTARGLQAQVKSKTHQEWSEEQCQQMIDMWLEEAYTHVKYYMERQKYLAKRDGFVQTLMGRRRYLPGVNSTIPRIREEAFRQAINHPVQGSAAEIIKKAMQKLWEVELPKLWARGIYCEPVLQIHDELIFEVDAHAAKEVAEIVKNAMQTAVSLCVPILADAHITPTAEEGGSWADLK